MYLNNIYILSIYYLYYLSISLILKVGEKKEVRGGKEWERERNGRTGGTPFQKQFTYEKKKMKKKN